MGNHCSLHWPPKQIENFLHTGGNDGTVTPVSEKTIEGYINLHMKGELEKLALVELRQKGPEPRGKLPHMTLMDERPKEVDSRDVPGHGEGDLIIGDQHTSALSVIVERKIRYVMEGRLLSYDAWRYERAWSVAGGSWILQW